MSVKQLNDHIRYCQVHYPGWDFSRRVLEAIKVAAMHGKKMMHEYLYCPDHGVALNAKGVCRECVSIDFIRRKQEKKVAETILEREKRIRRMVEDDF